MGEGGREETWKRMTVFASEVCVFGIGEGSARF